LEADAEVGCADLQADVGRHEVRSRELVRDTGVEQVAVEAERPIHVRRRHDREELREHRSPPHLDDESAIVDSTPWTP
jgi:hypothetical protein